MKQKITIALIILALYSCQTKRQEGKTINGTATTTVAEQPLENNFDSYSFDTILSGGFKLKYKEYTDNETGEEFQSLTLANGENEVKVLNEISPPMSFKNLGYIGADFDSSFVFIQSFGLGNPHYIQLIDKKTGIVIREGTWVDADEKGQILLYISSEHEESEQLKLYDIKNRVEIPITDFKDTKCVQQVIGGLRNCVEIDTATAKQIILKIETDEERIVKKYAR